MRKYKCPICGKEWDNLKAMYECALKDEANEENERKIKEQKQKEMEVIEAKIKTDFEALKNLILKYNLNYAPYNFEITLTHCKKKEEARGTENLKNVAPPLNYKNNSKSEINLEDFLKNNIGIDEPKKKNPNKEEMRKQIEDIVTDEDVKTMSSLYGDMTKNDLVDSLVDLADVLSQMGLPWN